MRQMSNTTVEKPVSPRSALWDEDDAGTVRPRHRRASVKG